MVNRIAPLVAFLVCGLALSQAAAQGPAVPQARQAPTVVRKKLIDATKSLSEALQALAKAEAAKIEATDDDAKQAAAKLAEEARAKAELLRAEVAKLNRQLLDAAMVQTVVARGGRGGVATLERENADPLDPYERFALLTPGGPVVVQVSLTVNGQPFRTVREKLIDELLAAADKDKDGKPTWGEAVASPRFTLGRIRIGAAEQQQSFKQSLDKNADGVVDRPEVRLFVAQQFGAPAFSLGTGVGAYNRYGGAVLFEDGRVVMAGGGTADVRALLDLDADGLLGEKEIAAAAERLKTRDADDNDLLYPEEISRVVSQQAQLQLAQPALLLGPVATAEGLFAAMSERYKNSDGDMIHARFTAIPSLFAALDKNSNGILAKDEVLGLNEVQPHVELTVDLGNQGAQGLAFKSVAAELTKTSESAENALVELPGVRLSFVANRQAPQGINFEQNAKAYLTQFDKDNNGYLETSEVPENVAQQVAMWDENEDGKVYVAEITASYARQFAPQASQVQANVASQGNSLFQTLDQTGDGRLSLREMRVASAADSRARQGRRPADFTTRDSRDVHRHVRHGQSRLQPARGASRRDPRRQPARSQRQRPRVVHPHGPQRRRRRDAQRVPRRRNRVQAARHQHRRLHRTQRSRGGGGGEVTSAAFPCRSRVRSLRALLGDDTVRPRVNGLPPYGHFLIGCASSGGIRQQ